MKINKHFLFILILKYSLFNISGTNSPIEITNLEPVNNGKRTLNEQTDNYIILEFEEEVNFEGGKFLLNTDESGTYNYNQYISYIINGNETIDRNSSFTAKKSTKLEVHFNQTFKSLESFFDAYCE